MAYYIKQACGIPSIDPDVVGKVFEQLESTDDGLTCKSLVDASRDEGAPLHSYFEWDDAIAGEKYREVQAGRIIRAVMWRSDDNEESKEPQVRGWLPVTQGEKRSYVNVQLVASTPEYLDQILSDAYRDAAAFKRKYSALKEVAVIISAIQSLDIS